MSSLTESLLDQEPKAHVSKVMRAVAVGVVVIAAFVGGAEPMVVRFIQKQRGTATDMMLPIFFWKHVGMAAVGGTYGLVLHWRSQRDKGKDALDGTSTRKEILCLAVGTGIETLTHLAWCYAQVVTTASHAIALFIMTPPWTCVLSWLLLGKRPENHTIFASVLAMCAAAAIIAASYLTDQPEPDNELTGDPAVHQVDLGADIVALLSGMLMAAYYTSIEWAESVCPTAPMHLAAPLAAAIDAVLILIGAYVIGVPLATLLGEGVHIVGFVAFVVLLSLVEATYDIIPTWASKYLSAPSISLILLLELPVGPLYVLTTFGETPSMVDWIAIGVILIALAIENAAPFSPSRQRASSRLSGSNTSR